MEMRATVDKITSGERQRLPARLEFGHLASSPRSRWDLGTSQIVWALPRNFRQTYETLQVSGPSEKEVEDVESSQPTALAAHGRAVAGADAGAAGPLCCDNVASRNGPTPPTQRGSGIKSVLEDFTKGKIVM